MSAAERETGDAILAAAAELIGERGYKGTTTRAIAERAGVNEVTVFRRFGNKQGVLRALGEMWARSMAGFAVAEVTDPDDTRGSFEALARMEVRQAMQMGAPALRLAFDARSVPEVAEVMGGGTDRNLAGLTEYVISRQIAGDLRGDLDARVMAEAFFTLTSTFVMSRQVLGGGTSNNEMPLEEEIRQLMELYWAGVVAKGDAS